MAACAFWVFLRFTTRTPTISDVPCLISLYRPISALVLRKLCELGFFLTRDLREAGEMPVPMGNPQAEDFQRKENQLSQPFYRNLPALVLIRMS
jgi:hypothetical protein